MAVIGIDTHKATLAACAIDEIGGVVEERSFDNGPGRDFAQGKFNLAQLRDLAAKNGEPAKRSGKQERYENLLNQYLLR